jgi:serine protease Do
MIERRQFTRAMLLALPSLTWTAVRDTAGQTGGPPDFSALIERIAPAVVAIAGAKATVGSGFVTRGGVVTAAHVVRGAGSPVAVVSGGERRAARVLATDQARDLALLEVPGYTAAATLPLATAPPRVGEWIVVLGNPFGAGLVATAGIVSATPGAITTPAFVEKVQINAAVNPGNSGGPICNLRGEVVAVASSLVPGGQGIAFATPAAAVERLLTAPPR